MSDIFKVPNIGENVFKILDNQELLKCRIVCKTWKSILDEPIIWLSRLKSAGHSQEAHDQWLDLIQKSIETKKPKHNLTLCLMLKLFKAPNPSLEVVWRKVFLNFPPIFIAAKHGQLEVVKLIHQFDKDCNRPISCKPASKSFYIPLLLAIRFHQNEVVKYLVENVKVRKLLIHSILRNNIQTS